MLNRFMAVTDRARSILAADEGRLWDAPLSDVDWMGIESDRVHLTADPGMTGYEQTATGLWSGRLPDGIRRAAVPPSPAGLGERAGGGSRT